MWGLVVAATARALTRGRAAAAGGGAGIAKAKFTLVALVIAADFLAAPHAVAVLPELPHIEGRQATIRGVGGGVPLPPRPRT